MKSRRGAVLALPGVLWMGTMLATGQGQSWNGWNFTVPAGWQAQATARGYEMVPEGAGGGVYVRLLPPQPNAGELQRWFAQAVSQQTAGLAGFRQAAVKEGRTEAGVPRLETTGQLRVGLVQVVRGYVGMIGGDGRGLLVEAQFPPSAGLRYVAAYGQLVRTLEPAAGGPAVGAGRETAAAGAGAEAGPAERSAGNAVAGEGIVAGGADAAAPAPSGNGRDLYDWFGSFSQTVMPGPNFTVSMQMVWRFYRFFQDGWVWSGEPFHVDPGTIQCPRPKGNGGACERFEVAGGTIRIGTGRAEAYQVDAGGLTLGGTKYNRVRRAVQPMQGTWKTSSGGGVGATVTLSQHTLTLRPDGTFVMNGSMGASAPNAAAYGSSGGSGRYALHGYTIEMDFSNGRVLRQAFMLPYPDDKVFLIGESMYFVPEDTGSGATRRR